MVEPLLLLGAPGHRRSECYWLLGVAVGDGVGVPVAAGVFVVDDVDTTTMALLDMLNGVREWFNHTGHLSINDVVNRYTRIVQRMVAATPTDKR